MDILVNVSNQKLKVATNLTSLISGTQEFVRFVFNTGGDWDDLVAFAQFRQGDGAYNQYLDDDKSCYLPAEIQPGTCTVMLYGTGDTAKATTNYLTFTIDQNILVADASSTEISQSLYDQLVAKVNSLSTWNEQNSQDLIEADKNLQQQINQKALTSDLTTEVTRAKTAEKANADAIALKADQTAVDELSIKVTQLENDEVVEQMISDAVKAEMEEYLSSGTLANMAINDGSLTREKVDSSFEATLAKADTAMQPSVYDKQGLKVDVYDYAKARATEAKNETATLKEEVTNAYQLTDTLLYTSLKDTIRGAVTLARSYTDAALVDYKAFSIKIVDSLPNAGDSMTFYLVSDGSGGYDKYWWITNDAGESSWDTFGSATTLVVTELPAVGDEDTDYILKSSKGCLYYKYIDGYWEVVAGSLAYIATSLPSVEDGSEYTDYYILNSSGSYVHHRFINGAYHEIGGDSYTKDEITAMLSTKQEAITKNTNDISSLDSRVTTNESNILSLNSTVSNLRDDLQNLDIEGNSYYATYEENVFQLHEVTSDSGSEGTVVSQFTIEGGGGGGGQSSATTLTVEKVTDSPLIITTTDSAIIKINFSSTDSDGEDVDATYVWKSGSTTIMDGTLTKGENSFDLSDYVSIGTQKFTLTVTDDGGSVSVKSWTVQKVDVRIESTFNDKYTTNIGKQVTFTYTPYGAISKTVHFKLDGVESTFDTSSSGTLQSYNIPAQSHGAHMFEVWITASINGKSIETSHIYKDIIWYDDSSTEGTYNAPVIGCIYRNDYYGTVTARQYDTTAITYNVYDPSTNYPTVERYADGVLISTDTLTAAQNTWNYKSDVVGEHTLKIVCGVTSVTVVVNVTELGIDVSPVTGGLEIDFNPTGITNASANRVWSNDNYAMTVSDNFDWSNGGYKTDENGDTYFCIKAGTSVSLDYMMFPSDMNSNPSVNGAEMKVVFMTENVQDKDAVWFTNVETRETTVEGVTSTTKMGIQMGVHEGWLKTNNASDTETDSGVAATNTYLYMPYSEEDIIEMDINIDTLDRESTDAKSFVMSYEDGVPSKAFVYDSSDRFYQYTPQPIVIGSDYCDVRIYRLKIYSSSLTTEGIKRNFIADSRTSETMLDRYDRNSIYYNRETNKYTPYSGEGTLDPEKLAAVIPNVKVLILECPRFPTSKKDFVKASLRCIHASGGDLYSGDPYYDNWKFENGYVSGQGTTSDNYGNSGRNLDFLFECDGTHKPTDKVAADASYVSKVTLGYNTENAHTETVTDWKGDDAKITLTRTSVPNNFFNLKVNIASSENVNNALLQKRYNDYLPYVSPAEKRDSKIKNDMEFVPAVIFVRETNTDTSTHNEFLDTELHFYALGNLGDSKKTDYTRAYDPDDASEFTIEISDNTKNNATFQTGIYKDASGNLQYEKFHIVRTLDKDGELVETATSEGIVGSYVYPIPSDKVDALWNVKGTITVVNNTGDAQYDGNITGYLNMRKWTLENEDFDGDHSFEPRYACCGDYRDGKLVNDTSGNGKNQVKINNKIWRAFVDWVVTSTDDQFVSEIDQWCVKSAVEFFYAFTHMYTMMDSRAKNTFWHFAKTGTYRAVSRPVSALLPVYYEVDSSSEDGYTLTTDTTIVSGKTYYTQYAFDIADYDNDTALGIKC